MKVLFVYPNVDSQPGFNYGVASLAAVLKRAGHEVSLINLNEKLGPIPTDEEFINRIKETGAKAVGFSLVTTQYRLGEKLARLVKEKLDLPTFAGGVHVSMVPEQVLESGVFDYAMVGECDDTIADFIGRLEEGEDAIGIPGVRAIRSGEITGKPVAPFPEIAKLPQKSYDIYDFQHMIDTMNGWVGLMASRGCPFSCTYCFNHEIVARYREETGLAAGKLNYIRHVPVKKLLDEIGFLLENYKRIKMFIFDDDLFTFRPQYVAEFCKGYVERGFDIPFVVNAHVNHFSDEIAANLKEAGCAIVKFGLESGNERVRKEVLNRPMKDRTIVEAFRIAHRHWLHTSAFLMIGLPTETSEEMYDTARLLARVNPGRFRWSVFYPFPGTRAAEIARKAGQIDEKRMGSIKNFFSESALDFGEEHNLLIEKMNVAFPWFVMSETELPAAPAYRNKIEEMLKMPRDDFEKVRGEFRGMDAALSKGMVERGMEHYAIKYNEFMGVSSNYFLAEEKIQD
ncbi:MAG: B12-binding domain-containing radical SAM protein [Planctomycetota bacterium]